MRKHLLLASTRGFNSVVPGTKIAYMLFQFTSYVFSKFHPVIEPQISKNLNIQTYYYIDLFKY